VTHGVATDDAVEALRIAVGSAPRVVAVGSRTHWEVGGAVDADALEVRAPDGRVVHDPADLTVRVGAGTTCATLGSALADAGQECPLDPRDGSSTVGGVLAAGLSGLRRLRSGPIRDAVLEVRFVTADGRVVRGGGPTVKNVTGFDLPRLLVGSLGTIGVLVDVILRCTPRTRAAQWCETELHPTAVLATVFRPSCVAWDGRTSRVLLEGDPGDVDRDVGRVGGERVGSPALPSGPHRGRISVRPGRVGALPAALDDAGVRWLAEGGVGTVHVAADTEAALAAARDVARAHGGWMLREAGAPGLAAFGCPLPNAALQARVRAAFDPTGKLGPGRWPVAPAEPEGVRG
jgi:glycolate oxidase FAD binding subunit